MKKTSGKTFTEVSFIPDYERFGLKEFDENLNLISIKSELNEFLLQLDGELKTDLQNIINKIGD